MAEVSDVYSMLGGPSPVPREIQTFSEERGTFSSGSVFSKTREEFIRERRAQAYGMTCIPPVLIDPYIEAAIYAEANERYPVSQSTTIGRKYYVEDENGQLKFDHDKYKSDMILEGDITVSAISLKDSIAGQKDNDKIMAAFKNFEQRVSQTDEYKACKTTEERLNLINTLYKLRNNSEHFEDVRNDLFEDIDEYCNSGVIPRSMILKRDITNYLEEKENATSTPSNSLSDPQKCEALANRLSNIHI